MNFKRIVAVIAATLLLAGALLSCGEAQDLSKKTTLVMATNPTFPPYEYMQGTEVVGVDIDIAREIANDNGWDLVVEPMDFDAIIPAVESGKVDFGAAGISITEERKKVVDFTIEYAVSTQVILVRGDSTATSISDLLDQTVGVQLGAISDLMMQDDYPEVALVKSKNYADMVIQLSTGKIDAIVLDNLPAQAIQKSNPGLKILEQDFATDSYALVVKKGNEELLERVNQTLQRLVDEGKVKEYTIAHLGN